MKSVGSSGNKSSELRDFILYRYYQSQYPELFSEDPQTSTILPPVEESPPIYSSRQSYPNGASQSQMPLFYVSTTGEEDKLASAFLELSLARSKGKLCKRSNTDTVDSGSSGRCCFMCRCSNKNQSDSSLWSLSEPDLSQMAKDHYDSKSHILANQSTNLRVNDEQYSHFSRVITPPNAFLNSSYVFSRESKMSSDLKESKVDDCLCANLPGPISYSNKVTQTDNSDLGKGKHYKEVDSRLQRFYSLTENEKHPDYGQTKLLQNSGGQSAESEHIYHSILEESLLQSAKAVNSGLKQKHKRKEKNSSLLARARSLKLEEIKQKQIELIKNGSLRQSPTNNKIHDCRHSSLPPLLLVSDPAKGTSNQCPVLGALELAGGMPSVHPQQPPQLEEEEHRIATSKNGIPCSCHRCRESRGRCTRPTESFAVSIATEHRLVINHP